MSNFDHGLGYGLFAGAKNAFVYYALREDLIQIWMTLKVDHKVYVTGRIALLYTVGA